MNNVIPPTKQALLEALGLCGEILAEIESETIVLASSALKLSRVATLLNNATMKKILEYETGGYPSPNIASSDEKILKLAEIAGRVEIVNQKPCLMYSYSIGQIESEFEVAKKQNDSYDIRQLSGNISSRKNFLYRYASETYYELKFSGIPDDVFARVRERVDSSLATLLPQSIQELVAVYDDLKSKNAVDWSNAVHTCRRILEDIADKVSPSTKESRTRNGKRIELGQKNYINRIIAFVEDKSNSDRFQHLVGSTIDFLGNRLDAIYEAINKGTHTILEKEEADRYVIYTYLLIGDILSLYEK